MTAMLLELPKRCVKCGEMKPSTEFRVRSGFCKSCKSADTMARAKRDPEKYKAIQKAADKKHYEANKTSRRLNAKRLRMKYKYGVSHETGLAMLAMQNDACGICEKPLSLDDEKSKREWHIDHCHQTGKIRGILCGNCNTALGLMKESRRILSAAIRYLKAHEVKRP